MEWKCIAIGFDQNDEEVELVLDSKKVMVENSIHQTRRQTKVCRGENGEAGTLLFTRGGGYWVGVTGEELEERLSKQLVGLSSAVRYTDKPRHGHGGAEPGTGLVAEERGV